MDLGIDRLVEMFEERFGRTAGTAVLALIGLAVIGLTLKTIYETILLPLANLAASAWASLSIVKPIALPSSAEFWANLALGVITGALLMVVIRYLLMARRRLEASLQAIRYKLATLEYEKRTVEQERDALHHFLDRGGGSPGLQSPKGTGDDQPK